MLALLAAGQAMIAADFALSSVALPSIERELAAGPDTAQWAITAMTLGFGGFTIVGGRLADIYGQKHCLIAGLAFYTVGAFGCGFSAAMGPLIACRALQGLGAAIMFPATLSLIFRTFAEGPRRFRALTISMAAQFVASPIAVVAAGKLIGELGWRGAFLINAPVGLVCLCLAPFVVARPTARGGGTQTIDFSGAILSTAGFALLVWTIPALIQKGTAAPVATLIGFGVGIVVLGGFVMLQRYLKLPLLSAEVLHSKNFLAGVMVASLLIAAVAGLYSIALISLQQGLHFSPLKAGVALLPYGIVSLATSLTASRVAPHILRNARLSMIAALVSVAGCHLLISVAAASPASFKYLMAAIVIAPIGGILGMNLAMSEALRFVRPEQQGTASALLYAVSQLIVAISIASMAIAVDQGNVSGSTASLVAFAGSFRIGVVVCVLGIGFSLFVVRAPQAVADALEQVPLR